MNNNYVRLDPVIDILVVEDSDTQANQLKNLLSCNGYRVRVAKNGHEGLAAARAEKPGLIISDIAMPDMDGFEMCRQLKMDSALNEVPVILLTALKSLYDVIKGLDSGADNFLRKPFDGQYLLGRIRFILANRALRSTEKVQLGMQVKLGGQMHFITAERQQIFDLLLSTYEEAINLTEELREQQEKIARSYQALESLYRMAEALNPAITEKMVAEVALQRALDLPGVIGGCIKLSDREGHFRVAAAQDFGTDPKTLQECADCVCRKKLLAGELKEAELIGECPALGPANASEPGERSHVSVPLISGARTFGILNLINGHPEALTEESFQVINTVGNQIAVALERAHLYKNMEALVEERTQALQAERNLLSGVVDTTGALVFLTDAAGRIVMFNRACEQALGWSFEEIRNRVYWDIFLKRDSAARMKNFFHRGDFSMLPSQARDEWIARDGSTRHVIWSTTVLRNAGQKLEFLLGTGIDVTELRSAEEKVRYLNNFDVLTGLPNRILLRDRIRQMQEKIAGGSGIMGFLLVHFPRLPLIREKLGGKAEQAMLQQITARLKEWERGSDSVARFDDSSFAVLALRRESNELSAVARQLLARMEQAFVFEQQDLHLEAAIGITVFPNDGDDCEVLSQGAEAAMRRALANKTERYEFYRPELNQGASERFKLESALRRAIERDELLLHYQPKVELKDGRIIGLEALVRWRHPELGMIPPGKFIGIAEETGLILPIGEWVLRKACEQNRAWQRAGLPQIPVAVNLSAMQFSKDTAHIVKNILDETGLEPQFLELELTESLSMENPENTFGIMHQLKRMGICLAIDDFGTGYSNLSYLKRFPVDTLKLDQSFVRDLISDPDDLSIARAVISMAHSLRLKVIAEGVETEGQLALLARNGCDQIQGYLFSRPVDADACAALLREQKTLKPAGLSPQAYQRSLLLVQQEDELDLLFDRLMHKHECRRYVARSAAAAFEMLASADIGIVVCGQCMQDMETAEFLARVKQMHPAVECMALSENSEAQPSPAAVQREAVCTWIPRSLSEKDMCAALDKAFEEFEENRCAPPRVF